MSKLIPIGFGNVVNSDRIIAIVSPDSAPIKRLCARAKENGMCIDATQGRRTRAVIIMENEAVIQSALLPDTIRSRAEQPSARLLQDENRQDNR